MDELGPGEAERSLSLSPPLYSPALPLHLSERNLRIFAPAVPLLRLPVSISLYVVVYIYVKCAGSLYTHLSSSCLFPSSHASQLFSLASLFSHSLSLSLSLVF